MNRIDDPIKYLKEVRHNRMTAEEIEAEKVGQMETAIQRKELELNTAKNKLNHYLMKKKVEAYKKWYKENHKNPTVANIATVQK